MYSPTRGHVSATTTACAPRFALAFPRTWKKTACTPSSVQTRTEPSRLRKPRVRQGPARLGSAGVPMPARHEEAAVRAERRRGHRASVPVHKARLAGVRILRCEVDKPGARLRQHDAWRRVAYQMVPAAVPTTPCGPCVSPRN
jgi:hypothetical protein